MNIRYLSYIEGNQRAAAARLGITPAALSKYLKAYEEESGTPLFTHRKKHFTLTPAGEIYVDAARRILAAHNAAVREIRLLDAKYTESISIGATPQRGERLLARIFGPYHEHFPNVRLKITQTYPFQGKTLLSRNQIDLLICSYSDHEEQHFQVFPGEQEELFLIVPDFHPAAAAPPPSFMPQGPEGTDGMVDIQDFRDSVFALYDHGTEARRLTDLIFQEAGFCPSIIYETNSPAVIMQMIKKGAGIGFLPRYYASQMEGVRRYGLASPKFLKHGLLARKDHVLTEAESYFIQLFVGNNEIQHFLNGKAVVT